MTECFLVLVGGGRDKFTVKCNHWSIKDVCASFDDALAVAKEYVRLGLGRPEKRAYWNVEVRIVKVLEMAELNGPPLGSLPVGSRWEIIDDRRG